jgi:hypothetical protein
MASGVASMFWIALMAKWNRVTTRLVAGPRSYQSLGDRHPTARTQLVNTALFASTCSL